MKNSVIHRQILFIHKWLGLIIGLFLLISCFTGAMIIIGKLADCHAPFFGAMKTLHGSLFLGQSGRMIIGAATLLLIIELITGYWLWIDVAKGMIHAAINRGAGALYGLRQSLRHLSQICRKMQFPIMMRASRCKFLFNGIRLIK